MLKLNVVVCDIQKSKKERWHHAESDGQTILRPNHWHARRRTDNWSTHWRILRRTDNGQLTGEFVDGQTIIGQLTGEFIDGQTIGQLYGEFVDGQTIGHHICEFVDGQTIVEAKLVQYRMPCHVLPSAMSHVPHVHVHGHEPTMMIIRY